MTDNKDYNELLKEFELLAQLTSHSLRDPLRLAISYCNRIPQNKNNLNYINGALSCLNNVENKIKQLREYSYFFTQKNFYFEKCDIIKILNETIAGFYKIKANKKLKINVNSAIKKSQIEASPKYLKQLFFNLIENALKFNDYPSAQLNIIIKEDNDKFIFNFIDNGIGIDHVYKELVFTLFQQINPEHEDINFASDSLGGGLAFAKKIVHLHKGEIDFSNQEDGGTNFYFSLAKKR